MGRQISSHYVYAQIVTNFCSCMMFSSGLPLLYIVGAIFSFIFYWVYKVLLMNYYMKTTSFNENLAINSLKVIEFGLVLKIITGSFMISNNAIFGPILQNDIQENYFY
jgi:hypothetical protein